MNMDYYQISAEELGQNAKVPLLKLGDSGEVFYELALEMIGEIEKNNAVGRRTECRVTIKKIVERDDTMPNNLFAQFCSPMQGRLVALDQVPDPVFAGKILGEGFAIDPQTGEVTAPFNATVTSLMEDSRHAVGLTAENGTEVLIHIGIDTVKLGGVGFVALVAQGDTVQAGQLLLKVDLAQIQDKVPSTVSPIVFTNLPEGLAVTVETDRLVQSGETGFFRVE